MRRVYNIRIGTFTQKSTTIIFETSCDIFNVQAFVQYLYFLDVSIVSVWLILDGVYLMQGAGRLILRPPAPAATVAQVARSP